MGLSTHRKQTEEVERQIKTSGRFVESSKLRKTTNGIEITPTLHFHKLSLSLSTLYLDCINFNTLSDCHRKSFSPWFLAISCRSSSVSSVSRSLFPPFGCPVWTKKPSPRNDDDNNYISECPFAIFLSLCRLMRLKFDLYFGLVCGCSFFSHGSVLRMKTGGSSVKFDPTRVTQLSWNPRFDLFLC